MIPVVFLKVSLQAAYFIGLFPSSLIERHVHLRDGYDPSQCSVVDRVEETMAL